MIQWHLILIPFMTNSNLCYSVIRETSPLITFFKISDYPMATTALSVIGYLFIDCTWISVYLITSELFPTVLR